MKTPITYYGGKQNMLKHILPLVPEHKVYSESFCGGAALLFAKQPVKCEVINDIDNSLMNFYRVFKNDYSALKREIDKTLHSRNLYEHATHINRFPNFFSAVQWAWAKWYLCKVSFAGCETKGFGTNKDGKLPKSISNQKVMFHDEIAGRLDNVTLENGDAVKVIQRYDSIDTFHFIDPPYINSSCGHYGDLFSETDFVRLLGVLPEIKGKFILTTYPNRIIDDAAEMNRWNIQSVERYIKIDMKTMPKKRELIITNY